MSYLDLSKNPSGFKKSSKPGVTKEQAEEDVYLKLAKTLIGNIYFDVFLDKAIKHGQSSSTIYAEIKSSLCGYSVDWKTTSIKGVLVKIWEELGKPESWNYLGLYDDNTIIETKGNTIMAKFFDTKVLVNGEDISKMQNSEIYTAISRQSDKIKNLEAISTKPKMLVDEIVAEKADLQALIDYLDTKTATSA